MKLFKKISTTWRLIALIAFLALYIGYAHPDWIVDPSLPKASAQECSDKCAEPPASNRPYFDACGNEYDSSGNLIKHGDACQSAPAPAQAPSQQNFKGK